MLLDERALVVPPGDIPGRPDADLDDFELPSKRPRGVHEPEKLVGSLRPAVEVVGQRELGRVDHLPLPRVNEPVLEPVGRVVRARHDHTPRTGVQRAPVDVLRHLHVDELPREALDGREVGAPVGRPGVLVAEVDHRLTAT